MNQYTARLVLFAFLVCGGCGSSGNSNGTTGGGGAGGTSTGGGTAKAIATLPLDNGAIVARMSADANGVVMTTLGGSSDQLIAISPSGAISTLYTPTGGALVINCALDGQTIYYAGYSSSANGIYSLPRAGGTPTSLITTDQSQFFSNIVSDADNLYVVDTITPARDADGGAPPKIDSLQQIGKSSGVATTIYTAPAEQQISNLIIDGGVLYWSENVRGDSSSAATIRSATAASAPLNPATVLEIPAPSGLQDMVETNGWIIGATLNTSTGSPTDGGVSISLFDASFTISGGVFAVPASGGTPTDVDSQSTYPIAANPGVLYLNHGSGLGRASVSANGVAAPTMIASSPYATTMAADHNGTLYYVTLNSSTLYKL